MDFKKALKISSIVLLILLQLGLNAQDKLTFSKVEFIELDGVVLAASGNNIAADSFTLVVPTGKVLKVESAGVSENFDRPNYSSSSNLYILLNDVSIFRYSSANPFSQFPLWLNEGTYEFKLIRTISGGTTDIPCKGFISAIEFNID